VNPANYVPESEAAASGDDQSSADEPAESDDASGPQPTVDAPESDASPPTIDSSGPDVAAQPAEAGASEGGGGPESGGGDSEGGSVAGNLVTNGDFSQGMTCWAVQGGSAKSGYPSDATPYLCVTMNSGTQYIIGWTPPSALDLPAGNSYTLSYKGWTTGAAQSVEPKVGLSKPPYTPDLDVNNPQDSLQTTKTFTHTFTTGNEDPSAGIAFVFTASISGIDICFDDVTLVAN
jgi:hypothetical protein